MIRAPAPALARVMALVTAPAQGPAPEQAQAPELAPVQAPEQAPEQAQGRELAPVQAPVLVKALALVALALVVDRQRIPDCPSRPRLPICLQAGMFSRRPYSPIRPALCKRS